MFEISFPAIIKISEFLNLTKDEIHYLILLVSRDRAGNTVLKKYYEDQLKERITKSGGFIEYAQYTRPEIFEPEKGKKWRVPEVLISGDHKKIEEWKAEHGKVIEKE